jgi:hypothetical protein
MGQTLGNVERLALAICIALLDDAKLKSRSRGSIAEADDTTIKVRGEHNKRHAGTEVRRLRPKAHVTILSPRAWPTAFLTLTLIHFCSASRSTMPHVPAAAGT